MKTPNRNTPLCHRKTEGGLEKRFADLGREKKITKKTHAVRGRDSSEGNVALGRLFCIPPANYPLIGGANVCSVAEFIAI
jgi:hypothetical protein